MRTVLYQYERFTVENQKCMGSMCNTFNHGFTVGWRSLDLIGVNVSSALDGMSSIHIGLRDSEALENLIEPEKVDEWVMVLTLYRVD